MTAPVTEIRLRNCSRRGNRLTTKSRIMQKLQQIILVLSPVSYACFRSESEVFRFSNIPSDKLSGTSISRGIRMEFPTEIIGEKGYIKVTGDLDTETAGEALRSAFNEIYDKGKRTIVLDLSGTQIINSYGIGKVLMCYKRLKAENGVLMVKPLQGFVKETFELLMLDKLLPMDK